MAKFQDPPLRTGFFLEPPTRQKPDGLIANAWQRHLVAQTNRHTQPNIPVVTAPPTNGQPGDLQTDGNFLYVCVALNTWKKVALV
jgi:hypothetical protein